MSEFPFQVSRHDQHNLEFKAALQCSSVRERAKVDIYLFLPGNLHLRQAWSRSELRHDFHGRLRLAIQQAVSRQESRVRELLQQLRRSIEHFAQVGTSPLLDEIFNKTRELGAVLGELLRYESRRIRQEMLAATSVSNMAPHPDRILKDAILSLLKVDRLIRETVRISTEPKAQDIPVLRLLNQYVHSLYTDFLIRLGAEHESIKLALQAETEALWVELKSTIHDLRQVEARAYQQAHLQWDVDEVTQELSLLRLSQIKKFFQSQMFIEVDRKETVRRFSEPAAAGAAAFAALWAAAFEYFSQPQLQGIGLQGTMVICTGVAFYVLKDRLKDKFRSVFTKKLESILPEAEQSLVAEGKRIGKVREWFSLRHLKDLPASVLNTRRGGDLSEAERHLPEDVIHYGQDFDLEPQVSSYGEFERSVQQVVRVNIERFLKHLDDPYKTLSFFDDCGELKRIRSHRVYHFHIAVSLNRKHDSEDGKVALYRIVIDKNGIDRVVQV